MKTKKRQSAVDKEVSELKAGMKLYADWAAASTKAAALGLPYQHFVYAPEWYVESNKKYRSRRHYCNLAENILDELEAIPKNKWLGPEPPAYHFHNDECISSIYSVEAGREAEHAFHEPVADQDVFYAWGYWPTNNQENRMKAITKFFNCPHSKGIVYFPILSDDLKIRIKAVSAKYDTWWV